MTDNTAARLDRALKDAGVLIDGVSIRNPLDKTTWTVQPSSLQTQSQAIIDTFDVNDPAHAAAELATHSLIASRRKDMLATLAVVVRGRNIAMWNAMTVNQKVAATLAEADTWEDIRNFIEKNL